jgi:hypothetical protein
MTEASVSFAGNLTDDACRTVAVEGQPGRGRGPAPAAELDRRGRQRPLDRGGRGPGAGAEPALGAGGHDQGDAQR